MAIPNGADLQDSQFKPVWSVCRRFQVAFELRWKEGIKDIADLEHGPVLSAGMDGKRVLLHVC